MPVLVNCSRCQRKLRIQDSLLGKNLKCPHCSHHFKVASRAAPKKEKALAASAPAKLKKSAPHLKTKQGSLENRTALSQDSRSTESLPARTKSASTRPFPQKSSNSNLLVFCMVGGVGLILVLGSLWYFFWRGPEIRKVFPVEGKVTIKGVGPLPGGEVKFTELPGSDPDPKIGVICKGTIQADGTFKMKTYHPGTTKIEEGVPEGTFRVQVIRATPSNLDEPPPFNLRFSSFKDTPLHFTVLPAHNPYEIELEK